MALKKTVTVGEYLNSLQAPTSQPKTKTERTLDAANADVQRGLTGVSAQGGIPRMSRGFRR
ncbi:hypothetical protein CFC35_41675 [Streptomyces sp. FBKL.4005]|uniref:Uncharacterized protein n=1 Tax=Streptomyces tricolor TaxID=68277 RepID=A0ABS9JS97_9ACTN|nr:MULTISPECIES: hypothetical protein [Streptomyces]MCG0068456.1 hypothetical protein [Streptomyces tricolor]OYP10149.1 hypothetical protein CFC35_41660 [Streptomyces sp. FBKL.4005]OYP10152.1 hypothetical protein CFC35_41675 [Streptomyces sp. FBKL.4005]